MVGRDTAPPYRTRPHVFVGLDPGEFPVTQHQAVAVPVVAFSVHAGIPGADAPSAAKSLGEAPGAVSRAFKTLNRICLAASRALALLTMSVTVPSGRRPPHVWPSSVWDYFG